MTGIYASIVFIELMLLIITIADASTNRMITGETRQKAIAAFILVAAAALGEAIGTLTDGGSSFYYLHKYTKLAEFCLAPITGVAVGNAFGLSKKTKIPMAIVIAHAVFQLIASPFDLVFRVDAQNIYHRESLYPIYVAAFGLSVAYCFLTILRSSRRYHSSFDLPLFLTLGMLLIGIGIQQLVNRDIRISYLTISISVMLLYNRSCQLALQLDGVTELLNRLCYENRLGNLNCNTVFVFFDLNNFKAVNDTYGHSAGDVCLKKTADTILQVYSSYGECYRIGGDEFCVILSGSRVNVDELNCRFAASIEEACRTDPRMPRVALGYAHYYFGHSHIQSVLEEADAMMYQNKKKLQQDSPV